MVLVGHPKSRAVEGGNPLGMGVVGVGGGVVSGQREEWPVGFSAGAVPENSICPIQDPQVDPVESDSFEMPELPE